MNSYFVDSQTNLFIYETLYIVEYTEYSHKFTETLQIRNVNSYFRKRS